MKWTGKEELEEQDEVMRGFESVLVTVREKQK